MEAYFSNNYHTENVKIQTTTQQLFLDIRDFADQIQQNNFDLEFTVNLSNTNNRSSLRIPPYDHVSEIELLGIILPKMKDESYFILNIPEFTGNIHSSDNSSSHDTFAVIYYDSESANLKPLKGKDFVQKVQRFSPVINTLNKFTIQFKKYGGDLINCDDLNIAKSGDITTFKKNLAGKCSLLFNFTIKA